LVNYRNSVFSWESVLINILLQQVREVSERETVRLFGVKEIDDEEGKVESPAFYRYGHKQHDIKSLGNRPLLQFNTMLTKIPC